MIRALSLLSVIATLLIPFTIDEELFVSFLILTIVLFVIDKLKRPRVDAWCIGIIWIVSLLLTYVNLMSLGYLMSGKQTAVAVNVIGLIGLLVLTIFNGLLNSLFRKAYKTQQNSSID